MKKLLYLFLTVTLLSCDSESDANAPDDPTFDLVGTWAGTIDEEEGDDTAVELVLSSDFTGSLTFTSGSESSMEPFSWISTDTQITITYDFDPDEGGTLYYSVIDQDTMLVGADEDGDDEFTTMYRQ